MKQINRRSFIKGSVLGAAALSLPARSWASVIGANEEIRVAVVGIKGQGGGHIRTLQGMRQSEKVRITALCDVDKDVLAAGAKRLADSGEQVETYVDFRKLLESKNVDAISLATPNHWHALGAIWAVQAGKDVYVEKPVSHNVWEGRQIVLAARKYNKIVQTGTQSRSSEGIRQMVQWINEGNLGKIQVARGLCYKQRNSIGKVSGPQPIPASIDYDLWCGPAPKEPLMRRQLHYDWHWVWPTGNGDLGNQGIHQMDIARWFLGETELAPRVWSIGGRLGYDDDGTTPNTQIVFQDYARAPLIFEVRGLTEKAGSKSMDRFPKANGGSVAVIIECEGGHVLVPDYRQATAFDKDNNRIISFQGASNHHANWIRAVRSGKHSDLTADILEGHLSSALCHTGNVSHLVGKTRRSEEIREAIKGDRDATATFERMAEHLAAHNVDISGEVVTLGEFLRMDPKSEKFLGHAKANELLTRDYRAPFVVPENV
jgi:predicted dehydrogenase